MTTTTTTPTRSRTRVHPCMFCDDTFNKVGDHIEHLATVHADRIGTRARTRRRWTCWACATENSPTVDTCDACGLLHPLARQATT